MLESTYKNCFSHELSLQGIPHTAEPAVKVHYKGIDIECGYRIDILVNDTLIVELKSVATLLPIHDAQLLTYMKLSGKATGLLMNFNVIRLKDGIRRMVL